MSIASIDGMTVTRCSVQLPAWGRWWSDVELDEPEQLSGSVTISIGGLTLVGYVMSGGPWMGRARYRIAGGNGGWQNTIASRGYVNDAGVSLSRVLQDAANDCGETLDSTTVSGTTGSHLVRESGPASRLLHVLYPRGWYVGEDGITRVGQRTSASYDGDATILSSDPAQSVVELAADDLTGLVPGAIVEGIEAVDVCHRVDGQVLRSTIYGARGSLGRSRLSSAMSDLIEALTTHLRYQGVWSYRVVSQSGERLDLQIERVSTGMPDLLAVRFRPGVPGASAVWASGSMVLVSFIDADPSRPVVVAGDDADSPGFLPDDLSITTSGDLELGDSAVSVTLGNNATSTAIGSAPRLGVARLTDTVVCGGFGGSITLASTTVMAGG